MGDESKKFPFDLMRCIEGEGRGSFLRVASDSFFLQRFSYHSASANGSGAKIEYVGYANPGVGISASGWAIKRLGYDASGSITDITWAKSTLALTSMFDDRATYTYG